jgi:hypothetical protein
MIRLVEGKDNKIEVSVVSSIDTTGFSIEIFCGGSAKTISPISDGGDYTVVMTKEDVASIPPSPMYGTVVVKDASSNVYMTLLVEVNKVSEEEWFKAIGYDKIPITIAANWVGNNPDSGGGGPIDPDDFVKKAAFNGISNAKNSVISNTTTINEMLTAAKGG